MPIVSPSAACGGGKNSRQRIFGGWRNAAHHRLRFPFPATASRSHPPPRKRRRVKNRRGVKNIFHSGESRNLILATARIFREAEHCNCRLSANAASPQRFLPTQEWKRGQEWKEGGNEEGAGMKRGGNGRREREWKSKAGMRDIADCLTLRRLRGGVKIRASEFLGGWRRCRPSSPTRHPPRPLRARTPPASERRVKNKRGVKNIFHSRKAGMGML